MDLEAFESLDYTKADLVLPAITKEGVEGRGTGRCANPLASERSCVRSTFASRARRAVHIDPPDHEKPKPAAADGHDGVVSADDLEPIDGQAHEVQDEDENPEPSFSIRR